MKSILKSIIIVFILIVTKVSSAEDVSFATGSYQEILDMAKQQNKIIMLDFITDWCKWCIETDRKVYANSEVADYANEHQINWKIDAEKGEGIELAKKYGVKGFPTIVFADADGKEIDRIYGYVPAEQFLAKMKDYNSGLNTYSALKQSIENNPDDPAANYLFAEKMSSNGIEGDVKIYLNKTIAVDPSNTSGYTDDAKFMLANMNEDPVALKALIIEYPTSEKIKDGYINLGNYYADKGDYETAYQFYKDAFTKYGNDDADLKQSYGGMLLDRGYKVMKNEKSTKQERNDAIKILEDCLPYVQGSVNEASVCYVMSDLYFQNENIDKANECIDKSLAIYDKKSYREQKAKINSQQAKK